MLFYHLQTNKSILNDEIDFSIVLYSLIDHFHNKVFLLLMFLVCHMNNFLLFLINQFDPIPYIFLIESQKNFPILIDH